MGLMGIPRCCTVRARNPFLGRDLFSNGDVTSFPGFQQPLQQLSSAHIEQARGKKEPKKGNIMVKGQEKCNILWIYINTNH